MVCRLARGGLFAEILSIVFDESIEARRPCICGTVCVRLGFWVPRRGLSILNHGMSFYSGSLRGRFFSTLMTRLCTCECDAGRDKTPEHGNSRCCSIGGQTRPIGLALSIGFMLNCGGMPTILLLMSVICRG